MSGKFEWPTYLLLIVCYGTWLAVLLGSEWLGPALSIAILAPTLTLHSSLQHEALHGHPTRNPRVNEALVYPALGLAFPYRRFKDTHLAHHRDENLTDPYDDPESNFLDPFHWHSLRKPSQWLLVANNTLLGRMMIGPAVSTVLFYKGDLSAILAGNRRIANAYVHHIFGLIPVVSFIWASSLPFWSYLLAAYAALAILRIRTFLEHRAYENTDGRTVIIEDRGPLSLLFLNNNFHAVHHRHPRLAWYRLPGRFAQARDDFLKQNGGYCYPSYRTVFARYLLRPKDPVPHPLRPGP